MGTRSHKLEFPQESVAVEVQYYDEKSQLDLSKYPTAHTIARLVECGVKIPISEFM